MTFDELGLAPEILRAVAQEGYSDPTPVQELAIPHVLAGSDLMARAQTGTGKTAAFVLPMLQLLKRHANTSFSPARHPVRALIVTPTRELAVQVADSVTAYGRYVPLKSTVVYGGVPMDPQKQQLLSGIEILVATPGSSSTMPAARGSTSARSRSSCWTRPTGCSTWASSTTSAGSWRCCPPSGRT